MTFDLLLKNFKIGHNFFIIWDKAFIFGMCVPYDKALSNGTVNFEHVTLTVTFALTLPPQTYTMPCGALPEFVSILVLYVNDLIILTL